MKKLLVFFGFILITIILELVYLNMHIVKRINDIEKTQKQYSFSIESLDITSEKTINGIDQSLSSE